MHRASSPYRAPSPYAPPSDAQYNAQQYAPAGVAQVGPGSITYTTSTGPDGNVIYHPYKAVAASYQTPSGVVSGIQWIPAGPTSVLPPGAQPMPQEYAASWGKSSPDWQRGDDKRRNKHEDKDLQKAREKDAQAAMGRDRRKSMNAGTAGTPGVPFPGSTGQSPYPTHPSVAGNNYPSSPYQGYGTVPPPSQPYGNPTAHGRQPSGAYGDLNRQFSDMDMGNREGKFNEQRGRSRTVSNGLGGRTSPYPGANQYGNPKNAYGGASPNVRPMDIPSGTASSTGYSGSNYSTSPNNRSTTSFGAQVYPKGHVLEGQPMPPGSTAPSHPKSRAPSPNPMSNMGKSPRMPNGPMPSEQLPAPEAFSRPINGSNTFAPFDIMKVNDLEDIYEHKVPKMPPVLGSHDIYPEDWKRCMQDLGRSWTGNLPVSGVGKDGRPPRPSTLAADLIDLWNASFFNSRGIELILYKGREKKTGTNAGQIDKRLPHYESDSTTESSESESDLSDYDKYSSGPYGRSQNGLGDAMAARRRRREERREKRRRRKERRARRKAKTYSVYVACLPRNPAPAPYGMGTGYPAPGGYPAHPGGPGGYPAPPNVPGGYPAPQNVPGGYGPPPVATSHRSHGYGGGY